MEFSFEMNNNMKINTSQKSGMNFEIRNLPQKEYIEKESKPCEVGFSANPIFSYMTVSVFQKEEEAIYD